MSLMASPARALVRQCARQQLPALRTSSAAMQKRSKADSTTASSYTSPFRGTSDHKDTTAIPSFKAYKSKGGETQMKVFQYFMVGSMGAVTALGAKATVQGMLCNLHLVACRQAIRSDVDHTA